MHLWTVLYFFLLWLLLFLLFLLCFPYPPFVNAVLASIFITPFLYLPSLSECWGHCPTVRSLLKLSIVLKTHPWIPQASVTFGDPCWQYLLHCSLCSATNFYPSIRSCYRIVLYIIYFILCLNGIFYTYIFISPSCVDPLVTVWWPNRCICINRRSTAVLVSSGPMHIITLQWRTCRGGCEINMLGCLLVFDWLVAKRQNYTVL